MSPTSMDRYLAAARKISRLAVASPVPSPTAETFRIASDLGQDRRMEGLPFGTRGGVVVEYNFPEDAEYMIEVLPDGPLRIEAHELEVTIDGDRVELLTIGKSPEDSDGRGLYTPTVGTQEIRIPVQAGPHKIGVAFLRRHRLSRKAYGSSTSDHLPVKGRAVIRGINHTLKASLSRVHMNQVVRVR